jgi:hypothetical protein
MEGAERMVAAGIVGCASAGESPPSDNPTEAGGRICAVSYDRAFS